MGFYEAAQARRRARINLLKQFLKSNVGEPAKTAIARLSIQTGISRDLLHRYLKDLIDAEIVKIENGVIKEVAEGG